MRAISSIHRKRVEGGKVSHRLLFAMMAMLWVGLGLSGCGDQATPFHPTTGALTASVVWPGQQTPAPSLSFDATRSLAAAGVVNMRATVSGSDMSDVVATFAATPGQAGSGTITGVPAGTNRTLKLEGLDSGGTVLFLGATSAITVTAGQTTDAGVVTMILVGIALYPNNGLGWNDYVKNDGATRLSATDTACNATNDGPGYFSCIHGGERRAIAVPGLVSCTGLTAIDALGAFDWVCESSTGAARMVSTGLRDAKGLTDLIDFAAGTWRNNSVTVNDGSSDVYTSTPSVWWPNPIVVDNNGGSLAIAGTIYIVTSANPQANYTIDASKIAVLIQPGISLQGVGGITDTFTVVSLFSAGFLWIEGDIDGNGCLSCNLVGSGFANFSMIREVNVTNAGGGLELLGSDNIARNVNASGINGSGISISGSNNIATNLIATTSATGVLNSGRANVLSDVVVIGNTYGLNSSGATDSIIINVTASNNVVGFGVGATNNVFLNVTLTNNGAPGISLT